MKTNFYALMQKQIESFENAGCFCCKKNNKNETIIINKECCQEKQQTAKPKLLLHSCCGPCSTSVVLFLKQHFDVVVLFYNPNLESKQEWQKRMQAQQTVCLDANVKCVFEEYENTSFLKRVQGLQNLKEGEHRCFVCMFQRMEFAAKFAKENNFDYFCTTLSVSPHKNAQWINQIGEVLQNKYKIEFLHSDFKKNNGFLQSTQISKQLGIYRQEFCGCKFSKQQQEKERTEKQTEGLN